MPSLLRPLRYKGKPLKRAGKGPTKDPRCCCKNECCDTRYKPDTNGGIDELPKILWVELRSGVSHGCPCLRVPVVFPVTWNAVNKYWEAHVYIIGGGNSGSGSGGCRIWADIQVSCGGVSDNPLVWAFEILQFGSCVDNDNGGQDINIPVLLSSCDPVEGEAESTVLGGIGCCGRDIFDFTGSSIHVRLFEI